MINQLLSIDDDKIVLSKVQLKVTQGDVTHYGNTDIAGNLTVGYNLKVSGTITADTFNVKNLVTENGSLAAAGDWSYNTEDELNGKGFNWTYGGGSTQLIYRTGGRLWLAGDFDLAANKSYKIDNVAVLSAKELGPTVSKSYLKEVGTLKSLNVLGNASFGEFAFFNTNYNRLGLGTEEPGNSISILDNDVEIGIGSPRYSQAHLGTVSCHDVSLISDNIPRLTAKANGEIHIGDESGKQGVLRVFGSIFADSIVTDVRLERTSPLEFKSTRDTNIYGNGLLWSGTGATRKLVMLDGPDRLFTTESFDIADGQAYHINGQNVLSNSTLGPTIVNSSLTSLGILTELAVEGQATFTGKVNAETIDTKSIVITNGVSGLNISNTSINTDTSVAVNVNGSEVFYADANEIALGNKTNSRKAVKVFGPVAIGINNPDPELGLSVSGNVSFANKKFITGISVPTSGSFVKGDICWNQDPKPGSHIGWVCIADGTPGEWLPFGAIGR